MPSGTQGFSHLHVQCRKASTEMYRKRDRLKHRKPKIWVKFSACPGSFGPSLTSGPCPHLPTQQYLWCFFPSPHPTQFITRGTITSDSGCNHHPMPGENGPQAVIVCQPQPSQTCHLPPLPSTTLPQSCLGTTSPPFLLWRCHCSSCDSSSVHSTGQALMHLTAASQLSNLSPPSLSPRSMDPGHSQALLRCHRSALCKCWSPTTTQGGKPISHPRCPYHRALSL